jgi:hypothetical protein
MSPGTPIKLPEEAAVGPSTPEPDLPDDPREAAWPFAVGLMMGVAMSAMFALGIWVGSGDGRRPVAAPTTTTPEARPIPLVEVPEATPAPRAEATAGDSPRPVERVAPRRAPARLAEATPDLFALREPARREAPSFLLPADPWFALGEVSADEPAEAAPTACRADRSLDTALTWAKSPAEASERAAKEGKLVFLIHVSGNFEDPGFT